MFGRGFDPVAVFTCFVPLVIVVAVIGFLCFGLPYMQAPRADTIYAYARKCVRNDPETVKSALRHRLVRRYGVREMDKPPTEYGCLIGFGPLLLIHFYIDIRTWITNSIVESRIDRAIDRLWRE